MTSPTYTVEQLVKIAIHCPIDTALRDRLDALAGLAILPRYMLRDATGIVLHVRPADAPAVLAWLEGQGVGRG